MQATSFIPKKITSSLKFKALKEGKNVKKKTEKKTKTRTKNKNKNIKT